VDTLRFFNGECKIHSSITHNNMLNNVRCKKSRFRLLCRFDSPFDWLSVRCVARVYSLPGYHLLAASPMTIFFNNSRNFHNSSRRELLSSWQGGLALPLDAPPVQEGTLRQQIHAHSKHCRAGFRPVQNLRPTYGLLTAKDGIRFSIFHDAGRSFSGWSPLPAASAESP